MIRRKATHSAHRRRRSILKRPAILASAGMVALAVLAVSLVFTFEPTAANKIANSAGTTASTKALSSTTTTQPTGAVPKLSPGSLMSAAIRQQNSLPGTSAWQMNGHASSSVISGFAGSTYALIGQKIPLYITTTAPTFTITAYRMGWYQGLLGRLIWTSPAITGKSQPSCPLIAPSNTVECSNWTPLWQLHVTNAFVPGDYLLKLVASNGGAQYIPLTVIDPTSNAAVVLLNAVTDWQAYNAWGGYSLYHGPPSDWPNRATKVSFDRPYSYGAGAGDFLGNELPMVALTEKLGLNVTYVNSIFLEQHPSLTLNHNVLVSLGHDEYYSVTMRQALRNSVNHGGSLMFLGANAIFRRIRFAASPIGPDRIEINYRNPYQDSLFGKNNARVTANWPAPPDARPESSLIGIQYECNPVNYPMVITDPQSWIFKGSGLGFGSQIPHLIGSEFDGFLPYSPHPANLQILANSPVLCRNQPYFSDMTYYSAPSGGGVFATGTNYWVASLSAGCPPFVGLCPDPATDAITTNIIEAFGSGGVGRNHPSAPNAMSVYAHPPFGPIQPVSPPTTTATSTPLTTTSTVPATTTSTEAPPASTTTSTAAASTTTTTAAAASTTTTTSSTVPSTG
ncbi:MAG: hypothetical protein M0Z29_08430 [Actinomycetota bacterium]|nr:hypothetical protein [Actinomycetota bacterium]